MKPLSRVKCPTCKSEGDWFAGSYGPFCSRRCRLIDLGKWFNQEFCISEPLHPEGCEKNADPGGGSPADGEGPEPKRTVGGRIGGRDGVSRKDSPGPTTKV